MEKEKDDASGCISGILGLLVVIWVAAKFMTPWGNSELITSIAKEYEIPISQVQEVVYGKITHDTKLFPIPHSVWYVTTERGEEIELASDYFGGDIDLDKGALNRCFALDRYSEVYRDYPGW